MTETAPSVTIHGVVDDLRHNAGPPMRPEERGALRGCDPREACMARDPRGAADQFAHRQPGHDPVTAIATRFR